MHGSGKKGVLCTGQARKKGGLRHKFENFDLRVR